MPFAAGWRCQSGFAHMQLVHSQCAASGVALHAKARPADLQLVCSHCAASGVGLHAKAAPAGTGSIQRGGRPATWCYSLSSMRQS